MKWLVIMGNFILTNILCDPVKLFFMVNLFPQNSFKEDLEESYRNLLKGVVPRILSIIKNTKFLFYNLNLV